MPAIVLPRGRLLPEALRILPDVLPPVRRLAADKTLPAESGSRLGVGLPRHPHRRNPRLRPRARLADDAILITAVLRGVARRAGIDAVRAHWRGTKR